MLNSNNPTAKKSQKWIMDALINLMDKMKYDKITVTAICYEASLDRRTFYRNFHSKHDVLEQYILCLKKEYLEYLNICNPKNEYSLTKIFLSFG